MSFKSWKDFNNFVREVKFNTRYIYSPDVLEFFLNIKLTIPTKVKVLPAKSILYRSQVGYEELETEGNILIQGFPVKRMKPLDSNGSEGRANPKGISYLYICQVTNILL